jgi:hypothetical protein
MAQEHKEQITTVTPHPSHHAARGGFANTMGIHPSIALFTLCIDGMMWGGEVASFGLFLPVSLLVSCAVGYVTYKGQQSWFGDSEESAKTKAIMLAVLTFIPSPLPSVIYAPLGFVGLFRRKG